MLLMGATIAVLLLYDRVLGFSMLVGEGKGRRHGHAGPLTKAGTVFLGLLGNGCDRVSRLGERLRRHRTTRWHGASRVPALLAFLLSPMILPHLIIAIALFYLYARIGFVGTSAGLVIGHTVIAVPYVVITVMAVLKSYDRRLDQAAATPGARPISTLRRITLPLIRPGLVSAAIFAFIISFDELTIALFTTGGLTETLPKQMWDDAVMKVSPALAAVSTLMLVFVSLMVLLAEWLRRHSASAPGTA
jgi:ABC-type spermidine/putrescine transport system permease subunit II